MTTAELAAEINGLTPVERRRVGIFVANLKKNRKAHPATKPYSKSRFYAELKKSREQAKRGKTKDAYNSLAEIREEYGIPA